MVENITAPVCPVSRSQPVAGQPGLSLPPIPHAFDLPSAIAALQQIALVLPQIVGMAPPTNNIFPALPFGSSQLAANNSAGPSGGGGGARLKRPKWVEVGRIVDQMRINNADDDSFWVEVDVIKEITFRDETSGNYLHWKLER